MGKRGKKFNKKAQMQISFGVIFAIILIIVFIAFAIYGIVKFLEINQTAQIAKFKKDLQDDINEIWQESGSNEVEYYIPRKIKQVCFVNDDSENMYFVPYGFQGAFLENVDMAKTVASSTSRPKKLCIDSSNGEISMTLKRAYNEDSVTITE